MGEGAIWNKSGNWQERSRRFCEQFGGDMPVLLAPMAGACPAELSIAVMQAGGWGAAGVLMMSPAQIAAWCETVRAQSAGPFQLNLWIPDEAVTLDDGQVAAVKAFLRQWSDDVGEPADQNARDFDAQCDAILQAAPAAVSSIMGVYPPEFVARLKSAGIPWFATATTVAEARQARDAGADVIVAQGAEAGGHRGVFAPDLAVQTACGLFSLLPAIVDAVDVPVVATGGIGDARGAAAAFMLGASAVQLGTGFLRAHESDIPVAWKDAFEQCQPEDTLLTRALTGRSGRAINTGYVRAAAASDAPQPLPNPIQRALTQPMTKKARAENDLSRMQAWAGQSARLAEARSASDIAKSIWQDVNEIFAA